MIAVIRFQLSGYLRSVRALHPILAMALLLAVVFSSPLGGTPAEIRQGALNAIADLATLTFPICAWAARSLLDTEPDAQRHVSSVTAGRRRSLVGGATAAYGFGVALALPAPLYPLAEAWGSGLRPGTVLLSVALLPLSTLAATALGALTSRSIIPSTGTSILVLLGAYAANLILGLGPLNAITVPMIDWMHAAGEGPSNYAHEFPTLAARTIAWTTATTALYAWLRRTRP